MLRVLDTFAGAGGFSLGFSLAGCEVVGAIETDKWACETFAHNHERAVVVQCDMHLISANELCNASAEQMRQILFGSHCVRASRFAART